MKHLFIFLSFLFIHSAYATSTFDDIVVENSCTLQAENANTVPYLDSSKSLVSSSVTATELGYLSGVTSSIQTQINGKEPTITILPISKGGTGQSSASNAFNALLPSQTGNSGKFLQTDGTSSSWQVSGGTVTSVTASSPLASSGGGTPNISIPQATGLISGYLSSTDYSNFDSKQDALTFGSISTSTTGVSIGSGANSTVGPNVTLNIQTASTLQPGLLSSSDWNTFNNKEPAITAGTTAQYWRGDKSFQTLDKTAVGLANVDNTSDANKPVSTATQTALNLKANLASPALTGSPTAPTQSPSDNSTKLSTTAYVDTGLAGKEPTITSGTTSQYWRGDKSFQTLDTSVVTENGNLYFTNARAQSAVTANITGKEFYVAKDTGNDSNSGGLLTPFRTIQAGINACNAVASYYAQCIVHVAPSQGGTGSGYLETVTFSQQGVNLICDAPQRQTRACLISGQIVVDLTGISGGANFNATTNQVYMSGFVVSSTSTTNTLVFSGTVFQQFISDNNYFDMNGSVSTAVVSNSGTSSGTGSTIYSYDTVYSNNNSTNPTISLTSGARFWMYGTNSVVSNQNASGPSVTQSGTGSSAIFNLVQLIGQYNLSDNTSTASFNLSTITSAANPCMVTPSSPSTGYALLASFGCNSSATNSITGTGIVVNSPNNVRFGSSGDIISTVTQASIGPGFPQGEVLIGPGATTGTNVALSIKDAHIKLAQTTAPTTTLSGNAGTGGTPACTITNGTDSGGKISLKTGTASWATGTQCTINFNKTWGVAPICVFSPSNDAASTAMASQRIVFPDASTSAQTLSAGVAFAAQVTATWHYHCYETQ